LRLRRRAFVADGSFLERIGLPHSILRNEPSGMYHTTGFTRDEIVDLCARLHAANEAAAESEKVTWPPILGLFTSVVVTLTYLRRNRIQAEIGESYGVSQSTISRAVTALTPLLGTTLAPDVPVAEDLSSQACPRTRPTTSSTAPCFPAGPGPRTPSCTPASTRPPA
jgi:hypothetical protein